MTEITEEMRAEAARKGAFCQRIQRQFEAFEPDAGERLNLVMGFAGGMIGDLVNKESIPLIADQLAAQIKQFAPLWGEPNE
jgi:hypothetical protein